MRSYSFLQFYDIKYLLVGKIALTFTSSIHLKPFVMTALNNPQHITIHMQDGDNYHYAVEDISSHELNEWVRLCYGSSASVRNSTPADKNFYIHLPVCAATISADIKSFTL